MKKVLSLTFIASLFLLTSAGLQATEDQITSRTKRVLKSVNPPDRITQSPSTLGGEIETASTIKKRSSVTAKRTKCNANAGIVYTQMDQRVQVETTISYDDCPGAFGDYQIRLLTRNNAGERDVQDFSETWQSTDQKVNTIETFYDVGDYPELVRAQVRRLSCTCSTAPDNADYNDN